MYRYLLILLSTALFFLSGCKDSHKNSIQEMKKSITKQTTINQLALKSVNNPPIVKTQKLTTDKDIPTPTIITIKSNKTTLNIGEKTKLNITATYKNNTTKTINKDITYIITPKDHAKINKGELTALKDGNLTIEAKIGNTLSNKLTLNIYWEVDGYRLPPEPDPKINNATLLGVDVNHNGVRDDVERWIYHTYNHPIERGIFMQSARANTSLLSSVPVKHIPNKNIQNVTSCEFYWIYKVKPSPFNKYDLYAHDDEVDKIQFNTVERLIKRHKYEQSLSGGVYPILPSSKEKCEFDKNGILKAQQ